MIALGSVVALGLVSMILRLVGLQAIVPFTLRIMSDVAQNAFLRVQRFSTDWHANTFAGSTVRKITRGMWALDLFNDAMLMALLPSLAVLSGSTLLLAWHWPVLGGVSVGAFDLRRDDGAAHDTVHRAGSAALQRMGHQGRRHARRRIDLQCGGQVVRRRSARGRRLAGVIGKWRRRAAVRGFATTTPVRHSSRYCSACARP